MALSYNVDLEQPITISTEKYDALIRKSAQYDFMVSFILDHAYLSDFGNIAFSPFSTAAILFCLERERVNNRERELKEENIKQNESEVN